LLLLAVLPLSSPFIRTAFVGIGVIEHDSARADALAERMCAVPRGRRLGLVPRFVGHERQRQAGDPRERDGGTAFLRCDALPVCALWSSQGHLSFARLITR